MDTQEPPRVKGNSVEGQGHRNPKGNASCRKEGRNANRTIQRRRVRGNSPSVRDSIGRPGGQTGCYRNRVRLEDSRTALIYCRMCPVSASNLRTTTNL